MAKLPPITPRFSAPELGADAKIMLTHFKDTNLGVYELPAMLEALFSDVRQCERAQADLSALGLITLAPDFSKFVPSQSRVRAAALTLEGQRYIADNKL